MYYPLHVILALFFLALVIPESESRCDAQQVRQGCRIHQGACVCGIGCASTLRYHSREECKKALKGKKYDVCKGSPCLNGGLCTQTHSEPYRCRCEGTGFYGPRCQYECPQPGSVSLKVFPYECVII